MKKYGYVVVEGPHDLEFVARLLKPKKLNRVKIEANLDSFWKPLIPRTFPYGGDLLKRVPVPTFFESDTHSIAIHVVEGDTGFTRTLVDSLDILYPTTNLPQLTGLGILLDADSANSAAQRYSTLKAELDAAKFPFPINFPSVLGKVSSSSPRSGIFILPDNNSQGTLEDLLLESAKITYPTLESEAQKYLTSIAVATELKSEDKKDFKKPAGKNKAAAACIASFLRPGKSIQVSIQGNRSRG